MHAMGASFYNTKHVPPIIGHTKVEQTKIQTMIVVQDFSNKILQTND